MLNRIGAVRTTSKQLITTKSKIEPFKRMPDETPNLTFQMVRRARGCYHYLITPRLIICGFLQEQVLSSAIEVHLLDNTRRLVHHLEAKGLQFFTHTVSGDGKVTLDYFDTDDVVWQLSFFGGCNQSERTMEGFWAKGMIHTGHSLYEDCSICRLD
ncbi:hypothetical protein BU16DRAFT_32576 [Lophium mytilinum]|uniref:Uncharacterized protein n=1 Tax=Lophium mytilinum TaxID=390894 RepID=A0A6A6RHI8_9PEZI|nr:hypothetical protein BU16DRAFT_32576 [Lophium mytilinum]